MFFSKIDGQTVSHECPVGYPYPYKDGKRCCEEAFKKKITKNY